MHMLNWHVLVLEPDNNIYREVLQPLVRIVSINAKIVMSSPIMLDSPP